MIHSDFEVNKEFMCGGNKWRCTDIGKRTIAAICLTNPAYDESWFLGPPFAVAEHIFDENDIPGCESV